jgi:hypothetical protein
VVDSARVDYYLALGTVHSSADLPDLDLTQTLLVAMVLVLALVAVAYHFQHQDPSRNCHDHQPVRLDAVQDSALAVLLAVVMPSVLASLAAHDQVYHYLQEALQARLELAFQIVLNCHLQHKTQERCPHSMARSPQPAIQNHHQFVDVLDVYLLLTVMSVLLSDLAVQIVLHSADLPFDLDCRLLHTYAQHHCRFPATLAD